jgi:hypothetical protein
MKTVIEFACVAGVLGLARLASAHEDHQLLSLIAAASIGAAMALVNDVLRACGMTTESVRQRCVTATMTFARGVRERARVAIAYARWAYRQRVRRWQSARAAPPSPESSDSDEAEPLG